MHIKIDFKIIWECEKSVFDLKKQKIKKDKRKEGKLRENLLNIISVFIYISRIEENIRRLCLKFYAIIGYLQ